MGQDPLGAGAHCVPDPVTSALRTKGVKHLRGTRETAADEEMELGERRM